jgi:hypothetical protein
MADPILELNAFIMTEEGRVPLYVLVTAPMKNQGGDDYVCCVRAPSVFEGDKYIYGVDPGQAATLAVQFIRSLLVGRDVTDADGRPISW